MKCNINNKKTDAVFKSDSFESWCPEGLIV